MHLRWLHTALDWPGPADKSPLIYKLLLSTPRTTFSDIFEYSFSSSSSSFPAVTSLQPYHERLTPPVFEPNSLVVPYNSSLTLSRNLVIFSTERLGHDGANITPPSSLIFSMLLFSKRPLPSLQAIDRTPAPVGVLENRFFRLIRSPADSVLHNGRFW